MLDINKSDIINAKNNYKVIIKKNVIKDILSWKDFYDTFNQAYQNNDIRFASFATMTIDKSERYTSKYNNIIDILSNIHPGKKASALSIVHFITRNNNELEDKYGKLFMEKFFYLNPEKVPNPLPPKEAFEPTVHEDPVDGFFIQFQGSTLWKIFYDSGIETHKIETGDLIFIPKMLKHSVESLCPRNAVSISFSD